MKILGGIFDKNNIDQKIIDIDKQTQDKDFWKDNQKAKKIIKEKKSLENIKNSFTISLNEISNLEELYALAQKENDEEIIKDCEIKINTIFENLKELKSAAFYQAKMMD